MNAVIQLPCWDSYYVTAWWECWLKGIENTHKAMSEGHSEVGLNFIIKIPLRVHCKRLLLHFINNEYMISDPGPFISPLYFSRRYFTAWIYIYLDYIFRYKLTSPNFLKCKICLDFIRTEDCIQIDILLDNYSSSAWWSFYPHFLNLYIFYLASYSL